MMTFEDVPSRHPAQLRSTGLNLIFPGGAKKTLISVSVASALGFLSPTYAALPEDGKSGETEAVLPTVISTGSPSGTRSVDKSLAPIDVISSDTLTKTAKRSLRDALTQLVPSFKVSQGQHAGTGKGVRHATLRGLSGNETLILVNGKRRHNSSLISTSANGASAADLDFIPMAAVDRVEVLRDGAAAQYGSDAIAGVINIILKKDASGGSASLLYGQYGPDEGGIAHRGATGTASLNQGFALGENGGFFNLSADLSYQDDQNDWGALRDSYQIYPKQADGSADPREYGQSRYRALQGGVPRESKGNVGYNAELPLNDDLSFYSTGTYGHRINSVYGGYRAPTNLLAAGSLNVHPDGYRSALEIKENDLQLINGLRVKDLGGWDWDISTSYSRDDADLYTNHTVNPSYGPLSADHFFNGSQTYTEWMFNTDVRRNFDTGLFKDPLQVVIGVENRNSTWQQGAGEYESYADGGYQIPSGKFAGQYPSAGSGFQAGYSPDQAGSYDRTSNAIWTDLSQKLTDRWEVSVGARDEDIDDVGSSLSGKFSTRFDITPDFAVRGTISNGFAAPTLQQLHYRSNQPQYSTNPTTGVVSKGGVRVVTADDAVGKALGAEKLRPEKSRNYSAGFVWKPTHNSNVTLDAYQIDIRDRIRLSSDLDGVTNGVVANALTSAGLSSTQQVSYFTNIGDTRTRGLDLTADYTSNYGSWGNVKWSIASNQNLTKLTKVADIPSVLNGSGIVPVDVDAQSSLTSVYPKNVTTVGMNWTRDPLEVTLNVTHYSQVEQKNAQNRSRDEVVKAAFITDLNIGYWITPQTRISIGANNLFDVKPNKVNDNVLAYNSYSLQQPVYSSISPYGMNGAFYFGQVQYNW